MYVDTHAHLFYPNFNNELDEIIQRAKSAGVSKIIAPGTDIATSVKAVELAEKYDIVYAAVGVHPHDTKEWNDDLLNNLKNLLRNRKVAAIGEIGLDYYYDHSPRDVQIRAFRNQLNLAVKHNLPAIIHNREADNDALEIINSFKESGLKAQFHCYGGSLSMARNLIELGHYISFAGNITYKNADSLRSIAKSIEPENLLLETDSPFMSPENNRGKRNEPANIVYSAQVLADLHNVSINDIARTTSMNVYKLFGIGEKPKVSFTYQIGSSLYVNITNRCNADCIFCDRKGEAIISGYNLKMTKSEEPPAETYIKEIGDPKLYTEIVFCGYGEPTIRWEIVKETAKYVKDNGGNTRLNTDGHGNFINKRDITPELHDLIDVVSISLNSTDPKQYAELMRVDEKLHAEMIDFAKKAKKYSKVIMSIVGMNSIDKENAKKFVTDELGVDFRERAYF